MTMAITDDESIRAVLRKLADREGRGGVKALAKKMGRSNTYLNDVIRGKKPIGPAILAYLGLERTYRRKRT